METSRSRDTDCSESAGKDGSGASECIPANSRATGAGQEESADTRHCCLSHHQIPWEKAKHRWAVPEQRSSTQTLQLRMHPGVPGVCAMLCPGVRVLCCLGSSSCTPNPHTCPRGCLQRLRWRDASCTHCCFAVLSQGPSAFAEWELRGGPGPQKSWRVWGEQPKNLLQPGPEPSEPGAGGWQGLLCPRGAGTDVRGGEIEIGKIYTASTGAKRGERQPRSETALPKFTMNLQECWRGETEGLKRNGKGEREGKRGGSGRQSRVREQDRAAGDRDTLLPSQNG